MANQSAFVDSQGASIAVREAPYPTCKPNHVVIKNAAIALNPIDWKLQAFGFLIRSWPTVLGLCSPLFDGKIIANVEQDLTLLERL